MNPLFSTKFRNGFARIGFDDKTREFIAKIKSRKPVDPPELHKQLKSYREWDKEYNSK